MAENKILPWAQTGTANVLSDDAYAADVATGGLYGDGVKTGQASSQQANKTWRQATAPGAGLGQFLVDNLGVDVTDADTPSTFSTRIANVVFKLSQISPFNQSWAKSTGGYRKYAIVSDSSGNYWVSTADQNTTVPGAEGANWQSLFNGYITEEYANAKFATITNLNAQAARIKLIPILKDYGAKGDGVTSDQTAIAAAIATGSSVLVTDGNYVCDLADTFTAAAQWSSASTGFAFIGTERVPFGDIHDSITLYVGTGHAFPSLAACLNYLLDRSIYAPVTVQIADGTYSTGQITFSHPHGSNVSIIGNVTTPANVVFNVQTTSDGHGFFLINQACSLSLINGMTINGDGWQSHGVWNDGHVGAAFVANGSSSLYVGAAVVINKMYYGLRANEGAYIGAASGLTVTEAGDVGIHAAWGGTIECPGAQVSYTADTGNRLGNGLMAECGGTIIAEGAYSHNNAICGFEASSGGSMWCLNSNAAYNGKYNVLARANGTCLFSSGSGGISYATHAGSHGVRAESGGFVEIIGSVYIYSNGQDGISANGGKIECEGASTTNNNGFGVAARNGGLVYYSNITNSGNTKGATYADALSIIGATYG